MFLKQTFKTTIFAVLLTATALQTGPRAWASSCCAGSGGQSICVLPEEQRYQIGVSTLYRSVEGQFDRYGEYTSNNNDTSKKSVTTTVGGAYRFNDEWQLGFSLPVVHNEYKFSNQRHSATELGDPTLEARYLLWDDLNFLKFRPQLVFYGGARFPLGNSVYSSRDLYDTNVTGDGTYTLHAGVDASKIYRPVKLTLDGAFFFPFSKHVTQMRGTDLSSPYSLKPGNRIQTIESVTYLHNEKWSATLGIKQLWEFETSVNGNSVSGSATRLFTSLASINFFYEGVWSIGTTYETAYPFYSYIANQPFAQSVSLAVTYGGL